MSDESKDLKEKISVIRDRLGARRGVIYQEYLKAMDSTELTISHHARELLDELQEIDQHIAVLK